MSIESVSIAVILTFMINCTYTRKRFDLFSLDDFQNVAGTFLLHASSVQQDL